MCIWLIFPSGFQIIIILGLQLCNLSHRQDVTLATVMPSAALRNVSDPGLARLNVSPDNNYIPPVSGLAPAPLASLAYCLCPVLLRTRSRKSSQTVVISVKCQHDTIQMEQISLNGTICQSVSDAWAKSKLEPSQETEARHLMNRLSHLGAWIEWEEQEVTAGV